MALTQEQVDWWFSQNPDATPEEVAAAVQSVGGLEANEGLAGMLANRYSIGESDVSDYYNRYTGQNTSTADSDVTSGGGTTEEELLAVLSNGTGTGTTGTGTTGSDTVVGDTGTTGTGTTGSDTVVGDTGNDTVVGGTGTTGSDTVVGDTGNDTVVGGTGNDTTYAADNWPSIIFGTTGTDGDVLTSTTTSDGTPFYLHDTDEGGYYQNPNTVESYAPFTGADGKTYYNVYAPTFSSGKDWNETPITGILTEAQYEALKGGDSAIKNMLNSPVGSFALNVLGPWGQVINAANAVSNENYVGAVLSSLNAAQGFGVTDIGGFDIKDVQNVARGLNAIKKDDWAGAFTAGSNLFGGVPSEYTTAANLASAGLALKNNDTAGFTSALADLTNNPDLKIAAAATRLLNVVSSDTVNPAALQSAFNSLGTAVTKASSTATGTKVSDAGEDVTLPGGVQLASLGDGVFRTDVGGTPTFAESKNAGSVTTPFGYSLLSATEADNKPEGSYYDPTANAWFKPDTAVTNLTGSSNLLSDIDLFTSSQGDLDQIAASTASTSDDATADFLASIGITNSTQLADSGLSNQDILDMIGAGDTTGGTGDTTGGTTTDGTGGTGGNITDTTGLDMGDVITSGGTGDDVEELVVTGDKTTNTDATTIDTITGGTGNDIVDDKGTVVVTGGKETCPVGTVLNPETGECDPIEEKLTCPPGKVLNEAGTACIDEVIVKDKKDFCPVGTVLNPETGECDVVEDKTLVCDAGYHEENGVCVKDTLTCPEGYELNDAGTECIPIIEIKDKKCDPGYVYDEDLKQCVPIKSDECPVGFHKDEDGQCVPDTKTLECPEGYELNDAGTECIPIIEIKDKKCDPGYVYDEDLKMCVPIKGEDECPTGYHRDETTGACVPDTKTLECPEGYELNDAGTECIPVVEIKDKKCDPGYVYDEDLKQCVPIKKDEECAEGFHLENGICVPDDDETCKDGYEKVGGVCVPVCKEGYLRNLETGTCEKVEKDCPPGQTKDANGKCVPIKKTAECQPGYERIDGVCVPVCKTGYKRVNGVCVPICPTGYVLVNGACVPLPTMPTTGVSAEGERTDPIYAGGMDDFDLFATLEELLKENSDKTDKKKDNKKSKEKTKMASGGYLDDLLAEQMTVDDLLKLLR